MGLVKEKNLFKILRINNNIRIFILYIYIATTYLIYIDNIFIMIINSIIIIII